MLIAFPGSIPRSCARCVSQLAPVLQAPGRSATPIASTGVLPQQRPVPSSDPSLTPPPPQSRMLTAQHPSPASGPA
jgi:hypothetical protein